MKRSFLLLVPLLALWGCAEERAPINRLQANAVDKHFFLGPDLKSIDDDPEFYMRGTVIDVGYGAAQDGVFTSTYAQPVSRIRWEVTEGYLNARLSYERIPGTDTKGNKFDGVVKKTSNDGQIVGSYKILSHFDVKRNYNPTTGEPLNIVEENTTDRPWNEREFMHVDWSSNVVTDAYDFDTLSMMGIYGGVVYEPLAFYVADPNDANAPVFDTENGYFDITVKAFAKPQLIDLSYLGWGIDKFPACMLPAEIGGGGEPVANCNPVEITIRQSFRKVTDKDYEPVHHDGVRFAAMGAFNFSVRKGYAWNYGMVDDEWYRFMARYNIWQRSHYYDNMETMEGPATCATVATTQTPTGKTTTDPNRDDNHDGTADECAKVTGMPLPDGGAVVPGSQCDVFKQRCTLPYQNRTPVTITWYMNGTSDEDLFEATNWAVQEWNIAMMSTIQVNRLVECRRTKQSGCDQRYPMWTGQQEDYDDAINIWREAEACYRANGWDAEQCKGIIDTEVVKIQGERGGKDANATAIGVVLKQQPMIVLCHNPVIAGDHPNCGAVGLAPRLGDLRYNSVLAIPKPQSPSAWGIMVDGDDPLTGEKVAASINIWAYITDFYAQMVVDLVRYMNGELATSDITNGKYVHDWVQANRLQGVGNNGTYSKEEVTRRLASVARMTPEAYKEAIANITPEIRQVLAGARNKILDLATHVNAQSPSMVAAAARMKMARGSQTEMDLTNPAMQQMAGVNATQLSAGQVQGFASPLGLNNPKVRSQLRQMRENGLAARGACIINAEAAPETSGLTGLADALKKKFPIASKETDVQKKSRYDSMWRYVRRKMHYAVISHEMGHSVGHRHNFSASNGALYYRPQYWQLRTKNGAVTTECTDASSDGEGCIGPRYFDPVTPDEQNQMIWMFANSSTMDYPGDISQDMMGIAIYDHAATRFFYGDTVAVYTDEDLKAGTPIGIGMTNATDTFGGLAGIRYQKPGQYGPDPFHYSQLQKNWNLIPKCYNVTPKAPSYWNREKDGVWDALLDGRIVTVDGKATKCRQRPVDYVAWNDLRMPTDAEIGGGYYRGGVSVDAKGRLRVPYHFATDHWADLGNLSVFRHDAGADPYEQSLFLITTMENRHILDNFRRNRTAFSIRGAADRAFSRYNEKLVGVGGGIAFFNTIYQNHLLNTGFSFDKVWPMIVEEQGFRDQMIAASIAFDHFTRQLSRPEPGDHYLMKAAFKEPVLRSASDSDGSAGTTLVTIPNGTTGYMRDISFFGAPIENQLSDSNGDFDVEYQMNAGSYYNKINSLIHMSLSEDRFISQSRQDFYDARFRANGMADIFPDGYRRLVANALTNDRWALAPRLAADASGKPLVGANQDPLDPLSAKYPAQAMGWVNWWPAAGPAICFASNGKNLCNYDYATVKVNPDLPANMVPVDPQIGWEVQKFIIANVLTYIPANQQTKWIDMMSIYHVAAFNELPDGRIEFEDPWTGIAYFAKTHGTECLFGSDAACTGGKIVQKGIAARVIEQANYLVSLGYKLDTGKCPATAKYAAGFSATGRPCFVRQPDGTPVVAGDPAAVDAYGKTLSTCDQNVTPTCKPLTLNDNHWAFALSKYKSNIDFLIQAMIDFRYRTGGELGMY